MYEFSDAFTEERFWSRMQGLAAKASAGDVQALQELTWTMSKLARILSNATNQTNGAGHNHFCGPGGVNTHTHC